MLGRSAMSAATGSASGRPDRRNGCRSVGGRRFLRSQCRWPGCLKGRAEADPASGSADTIRVGGWPVDSNGGRRSPRASARRDAGLRRRIACSGTSMCQPWGRHLGWALKPVGRVGGYGPVLGAADHQLRGMRRWPWRFAGMKRRRGSSGRGRVRGIYNSASLTLHNVDYRHLINGSRSRCDYSRSSSLTTFLQVNPHIASQRPPTLRAEPCRIRAGHRKFPALDAGFHD